MPELLNLFCLLLSFVCNILLIIVIASVMISWLEANPHNQIVETIQAITEPIYRRLRPLTRKIPGPLDWAPLTLCFFIMAIQQVLIPYLQGIARSL